MLSFYAASCMLLTTTKLLSFCNYFLKALYLNRIDVFVACNRRTSLALKGLMHETGMQQLKSNKSVRSRQGKR
jgi:hypothetical protein